MLSFLLQWIPPVFYALKRHTMQQLVGACLILGLSAGVASANTIEQISLEKQADGKLNINVNVTGNARELAPDENDAEGVYTLGLQGKTSDKVKATPLVMDASGQHIARLNVENGKVSVVVPGVSSKDIRVNMRNSTGESTSTASNTGLNFQANDEAFKRPSSDGYAMANTWTPKGSSTETASINSSDSKIVPSFDFNETTESTTIANFNPYQSRSQKSTWHKKKNHTFTHHQTLKHRAKSAPPVSWVSALTPKSTQKIASADLKNTAPSDAILDEVATLEGGIPLEDTLENIAVLSTERTENTMPAVEETPESFVVNPFSDQMYDPNPAVEHVISEEAAYLRYLQLPWENETWLNERVESSLAYDMVQLNASLWMMYLCIGGMVLAVALGLAFKMNPRLAQAMAHFRAGLLKTTHPAPLEKKSTEKASPYSDEEKPFASWLMPEAEDGLDAVHNVEQVPSTIHRQTLQVEDALLANEEALVPLDAVTPPQNSVFVMPTPNISSIPLLYQAAQATPQDVVEVVEAPVVEAVSIPALPKLGKLKAPTYFAFRHHQKSRQDTPSKAPMKALFALPKTPVKPVAALKPLEYSRLNRLHFG
ncbi:MAG: hypothetical protein ACK5T0_06930 [Vampirovibrionales bacterium]